MKLTIAVCDKEKSYCEAVQRKILQVRPEYNIVLFQSGNELIRVKEDYDIVFLNTELSDKNGIEVAKELRRGKYKGWIIFFTSHIEFVLDVFKVKAFRFLKKPMTQKQLIETIMEIEREVFQNRKFIILDSGDEMVVKLDEILFVKAVNNKTILHTISETIETGKPLKYWKEMLGAEFFFQTHKSYIVGLKYVKNIKDGLVTFDYSDKRIPVSRRNYVCFKNVVYTYIEKNTKYM